MNTNYVVGLLAVIALVLGGLLLFPRMQGAPVSNTQNNGTTTTGENSSQNPISTSTQAQKFTQVSIALLDTTGSGSGKSRGCDTITMVKKTVPETTAPLTAALQALFAEPEGAVPNERYNFIARTKSTLKFDRVTITSGTANIYLTGSLSGLAGVCDDPRAAIQLEETALQFSTVKKVQLYLNGTATNLTPSQQ